MDMPEVVKVFLSEDGDETGTPVQVKLELDETPEESPAELPQTSETPSETTG